MINAALALELSADAPPTKAQRKLSGEEKQVIDIISTVFGAVLTEHVAKLDAVIAPVRDRQADVAGIGLSAETGGRLEDRLHA